MRLSVIKTIACVALLWPAQSIAQTAQTPDEVIASSGYPAESIAAVVNDEVITTFDLNQRLQLMILSSGGQIPADALPRLKQQALRDLVEEKLKLQEAERFDAKVPDNEVRGEIANMGAQSGMTYEQFVNFLDSVGISTRNLENQIKASIIWPQIVQGRFRDRVRINEDEVEDTLVRLRADAGEEQYLVSEICIPVPNPSQAQEFYQGSLQLIEQIKRGVPFSVVAQQFSACTTAAVGGDMGWVRTSELQAELDEALRDLPPGSVTNPIPSEGAFIIMAVRDRRQPVAPGEPSFTLAFASAAPSVSDLEAREAFEKLPNLDACSGGMMRADPGKGIGVTLVENVTLDQIDERFQPFVEDLGRGDTSGVVETETGRHAVYVCDKDEGLGLPSRAAIENRIYGRQLSRIGQQYLRDIERKSTVDIRIDDARPNG